MMTLAGANGPRYRYKELGIQTLVGLSRIAGGVVTLSPSEDPQQPLISSPAISNNMVDFMYYPRVPSFYSIRCTCLSEKARIRIRK